MIAPSIFRNVQAMPPIKNSMSYQVMFHSSRGYENWMLVNWVTVVLSFTAVMLTVLEIKKRKQ